jgi:hypothetical protein
MPKDKYDFIQELLENKKLSPAQRERVLLLIKEEIRKEGLIGKGLADRLTIIEELVNEKVKEIPNAIKEPIATDNPEENNQDLPKYFDPSNLYKYLVDYNQNPILKSTCHEIDSNELENILEYCETAEYDFEKHLGKILDAFREHDKKPAPGKVKALIRGYLTGKDFKGNPIKGWTTDKISHNWSSPELLQWSINNKGVPPNVDKGLMKNLKKKGYQLSRPFIAENGSGIYTFSNLVLYFKCLFHVRSDNSLKNIIRNFNKAKGWEAQMDFEISDSTFPNNVEIFTDVDKFLQAYKGIIELILEQSIGQKVKPIVRLSLKVNGNSVEFSIFHVGSVYGKTIEDTTGRLGNKYRGLIKNQINGLCKFYVQADFEAGVSYRVGIWNQPDLWNKIKPIPAITLEKPIGGVEHIFEIVKPNV